MADFVNESQFEGGKTGYACVAFCAALCKFAGQPNHGPIGTGMDVSNLAYYWYGRLEGSTDASNTNGMSLQAEYDMLQGLGLQHYPAPATLAYIKAWLTYGYPVMVCGAETGMYDLDLGDIVPYSWTPTGNHCIVASGIASDGNLLVRDTASIAPTGVRQGPRRYDVSKLQLVSVTAVAVPWLPLAPDTFDPTKEEPMQIDSSMPIVSNFFTELNPNQWQCKSNGKIIQYAILQHYKTNGCVPLCGISDAGLPVSNEIPIEHFTGFEHLIGKGIVVQFYERATWIYDQAKLVDNPPDSSAVYPLHLYAVPGQDPAVSQLQQQVAQLQAELAANQQPPAPDPRIVVYQNRLSATSLQLHTLAQDVQAIESFVAQPVPQS